MNFGIFTLPLLSNEIIYLYIYKTNCFQFNLLIVKAKVTLEYNPHLYGTLN